MSFLTEEQQMMQQTAKKIARDIVEPRAAEVDETDEFPMDLVEHLNNNGLLTMALPEEFGGISAGAMELSLVIEELCKVSGSMGPIILSTNSCIRIIDAAGNDEQRKRFFTRMASGPKMAAFCLTETNAGSDAHSLTAKAKRVGDEYVLTGTKIFITLAAVSDLYVIFLRTEDNKISAFVVEAERAGVSFGKKERKMGLHGTNTADLILDEVRVPVENRLGEEGDGWKILNTVANTMRAWGAGSIGLGIAQGALEQAAAYALQRKQFGRTLSEFQAIQFMLADMDMQTEAARNLIRHTNRLVDASKGGVSYGTLAKVAMAKCFATDTAMKVTTDAVQVFGGNGYMKDYPVERMMRDAKILQILDGSNQVQRMIISKNLLRLTKVC